MNKTAMVAAILDPLVSANNNFRPHFHAPYRLSGHEFGPEGPQTPEEWYYNTYIRWSGVRHPQKLVKLTVVTIAVLMLEWQFPFSHMTISDVMGESQKNPDARHQT